MRHTKLQILGWPLVTFALVLLGFAVPAPAQDTEPVVVSIDLAGNAVPGRTVRATANVEINDGSTLESFAWSQMGGVTARLRNADAATVRARLGTRARYRDALIRFLDEPPVGPGELPPNVPFPEDEEFPGGLRDRFEVVGVNGFALEEAGRVILEVAVTTSSGIYHVEVEIDTTIPWAPAGGIRNVPIGRPVLLQGKAQETYNWRLDAPDDSGARILGAATRNPEFTPDIPGVYTLRVRDEAAGGQAEVVVYAGTWRGMVVAQDAEGRPVADGPCTSCHRDDFAPDMFTPWSQTGHAESFTQGLNTNSHFSSRCFSCHAVGYDPEVDNGGIDEAPDYQDFLDADLLGNPDPDNWTRTLEEFPATAQLSQAQCEVCHGPNASEPRLDTLAHGWQPDLVGEPRKSLASDVCATCHGDPLRHGRFQQWQLSGHANYNTAGAFGGSGSCARCHTANGFLAWLPVLQGEVPGDPLEDVEVTWTSDEVHPTTCVTCHDPHSSGTTSGLPTDATVRISGDTPSLIAGFQVVAAGRGAICMTCHNSRRGLRNDRVFPDLVGTGDLTRAPHGSAQTDVLMGENAFLVNVGVRGRHSLVGDTCVACHMERTPPPDVLSYNQSGSNHTFFASPDVCTSCHEGITADGLQRVVGDVLDHLRLGIEQAIIIAMDEQVALGNRIDLGGTVIDDVSEIREITFTESRGRQAITVRLRGGVELGTIGMNSVNVVQPDPLSPVNLYDLADEGLIKAGWNWGLIHNDGSYGAHNPSWTLQVLDAARDALDLRDGPRAMLPVGYPAQ